MSPWTALLRLAVFPGAVCDIRSGQIRSSLQKHYGAAPYHVKDDKIARL